MQRNYGVGVMVKWRLRIGVGLACLLVLAGCAKRDGEEALRFEVRGYVEELRTERSQLVIDHEEMPGYMPAMVMPFRVKDWTEAEDLEPGERIEFVYIVDGMESWIENIERTGEIRETARRGHFGGDSEALLGPGDFLPEVDLLNEDGGLTRISDFRGAPVALTFVFTRCPVPEFCPAMMRGFAAVDALLGEGALDSWTLLSISIDPEHDTPEVMRSYGEAFGVEGDRWKLLTADSIEAVAILGRSVGLKFGESGGSIVHNLRTVVLNAEGRIRRVFLDEDWTPEELVAELTAAGGP